MRNLCSSIVALLCTSFAVGCGGASTGGTSPTDVRFGDTALVVVVNPVVNDANSRTLPAPGPTRAGVRLTSDDGVAATTDADGIAVLAPVTAGARTITVSGSNAGGTFAVTLAAGQLREVAVSTLGTTADVMVNLDYKSDRVTELDPTMSIAAVNDALAVSDTVVFFKGGVYTGDVTFAGSRVTLFGEGALGGRVTIQGNVTVSGSDDRIRGTRITGTLTVPASGAGLTFSRVDGATSSSGSDATFLANALCAGATITGSGSIVLDNAGAAPIASCP